MANLYQEFLKLGIDLSPLGVERHMSNTPYFCTPRGASIIGRAGVDGIHYCFIRGFGEMVFSISPANVSPEYVHPLAKNFEDFLRLLLACGDASALEQAWLWDEVQFNDFLSENPPTQEQTAALTEITNKLNVVPMENPWQYIKSQQVAFDYGKIKYTQDFYDLDMNPHTPTKPLEWKVYFEGNFWGHSGRDRAGKELAIGAQFEWAGRRWLVPSVYSCGKGLVVDFCMRIEPEEIRAFMDKWHLNYENEAHMQFSHEQRMEIDRDNPLSSDFDPIVTLNGKELASSHGCGICHNPCMPEGVNSEPEIEWVTDHYTLDRTYGWMIRRVAFPWKATRKPEIKTLSITMAQRPVSVPGPHFRVGKQGDILRFTLPETGVLHTLTVQDYEHQELPENCFGSMPDKEFPRHYTVMSYTIEPDVPDGAVTLYDCAESDTPKQLVNDSFAPAVDSFSTVGVIGGADGPTAIFIGGRAHGKCRAACSSLHYIPVNDVEWRITFREKRFEDLHIKLLDD